MSSEFYQTRTGERFFNQQLPDLIQMLGRLVDALTGGTNLAASLGVTCPPDFFRDLMDGDWDAYQELSTPVSAQYRQKHKETRELERQLRDVLSPEHYALLDQYQAALLAEEPEELEHAFLVGYQTAVKLILMGVTPKGILLSEREQEP